jgi:hypothetical protein
LATLFVISLAFSLLFGVLRQFGISTVVFAVITGFVAFVAASQALLFRGKWPRAASIVAGVIFYLVGTSPLLTPTIAQAMGSPRIPKSSWLCGMTSSGILGYLAGCIIAGVFLVADQARKHVRWLNLGAIRSHD